MSNVSPYGAFTGRRLYSTSKIDNEIEEVLHKQRNLEPSLRMPTNPNTSPFIAQRAGHSYRAEWLREAKEWQRGLVGTEDDRKLKQRILDRILRVEEGLVRVPGHLAMIPSWNKIGGRTFKRYFGIDYVGGRHMAVMPDSLRNAMTGRLASVTSTSGFQEAINSLAGRVGSSDGHGGTYANGGVLDIFPGLYTSDSVWQLPSSTTYAFDFTMQGNGKSNTAISIGPTGTQTAAIQEGHSAWIKGTMGPRFTMRDLSLSVGGTYTGTSATYGDSSHGGVVSLQYYSTFFEHVGMSINVRLTAVTNLLKCGMFAGPSQPCTWNDFDLYGYAGANLANVVAAWFEGFSWRGGEISLMDSPNKGSGIAIRSNGPNYLGQIDSYDYLTDAEAVNNWMNFITCSGISTLDAIEYPVLSHFYTGANGGTVNAGAGNCLTIMGIESEATGNFGDPSKFGIWNGGLKYLKTLGFSLGLQNGNQWNTYLSGPFDNNAASGGEGYLLGPNCYNGVTVPRASTIYMVTTDLMVNSTGGSNVSITIYDQLGNTIISGLTTLAGFRMSIGMQINFGPFTAPPSVSVYQVAG